MGSAGSDALWQHDLLLARSPPPRELNGGSCRCAWEQRAEFCIGKRSVGPVSAMRAGHRGREEDGRKSRRGEEEEVRAENGSGSTERLFFFSTIDRQSLFVERVGCKGLSGRMCLTVLAG